jgi:hypothetical protein
MGGEMAQGGACASLQVGGGDARRGEDGGASKGNERERERERGKREREDAGCVMCIDAVQIFSGSRVEHALQEFAASNNSNRVIDTTATTPRRRPSGQALEEDSRWRKKTQFKQLEKQGGKKISNSKNRSNPHRR